MNVVGLRRAGFDLERRIEIRRAINQLFRAGMPLRSALKAVREQEWGKDARKLVDFVEGKSQKGVLIAKGG